MPSINILLALIPIVFVVALAAPPHLLLAIDVVLVLVPGEWVISGVSVDSTDLVFAGIILALVARSSVRQWAGLMLPHIGLVFGFLAVTTLAFLHEPPVPQLLGDPVLLACQALIAWVMLGALVRWGLRQPGARSNYPYLTLWIIYGTLVSVAYLQATANRPDLTNGVRAAYQVYRYCWRPTLYYLFGVLLLGDELRLRSIVWWVVLAADACALIAASQGYAGFEAMGPFLTKNQLGAALIMPFVLALAGLVLPRTRNERWFYAGSVLMMLRALTIAGSRGAFVAAIVGGAALLAGVATTTRLRARVGRLTAWAVLLAVLVLAVKPNVFERPAVLHLLAVTEGTSVDTFQWRIHERWPHFFHKLTANPWFGTGTDVDLTLGESGNTPHNGYLAIALVQGVPAVLIFVMFAALGLRDGLRLFFRAPEQHTRILGLAVAAALIGALVHNSAESTLRLPFAVKVFWMLVGGTAILARQLPARSPAAIHQTVSRRVPMPAAIEVGS